MCAWRQSGADSAPGELERRGIGLLIEGLVTHQVQVNPDVHRRLRSAILRDSIALAEPVGKEDMLARIGSIIRSFEGYRSESESILDFRQKAWHQLVQTLLLRLAESERIDLETEEWRQFSAELGAAIEAEQLADLRSRLLLLLHHHAPAGRRAEQEEEQQDRSTLNDNAAGLRGGGAALEHIGRMIASKSPGYIAIFRLSCLDVIGERFGPEGVQDCVMTIAHFLDENLRHEDTVYYWSESSLLAVCDRKVREEMISAELNRVLARNRDFSLQIGGRYIMLRIPIAMQLLPIQQFETPDELLHLNEGRGRERIPAGRI
ncbi:MAG TPA: hypothetical protein VIM62_10410 [Acidobacteriaceae bacterium]